MLDTARAIQYKQIEFLRLFRLGREKKYFKRKRKMPIDYSDIDSVIKCCKRLFRDFLVKAFPKDDGFIVSTKHDRFIIKFKPSYQDIFVYFMHQDNVITHLDGGKEILEKFDRLINVGSNGFIITHVHHICVYISEFNYHVESTHPESMQRLYFCAKEVIEYKKIWDEVFPDMQDFYNNKSHKEEEKKNCKKPEKIEKKQQTQIAFNAILEEYLRQQDEGK